MSARLLSHVPISGTIQERRYQANGFCTWVEFTPEDDLPWVGVFGHHGLSSQSDVAEFNDVPYALIIAHGVGWIVNIADGTLLFKTEQVSLETAIPMCDSPFVIAADCTTLYVYSINSCVWSSGRIALDGVRLDSASPGVIHGRTQASGWLACLAVECGPVGSHYRRTYRNQPGQGRPENTKLINVCCAFL